MEMLNAALGGHYRAPEAWVNCLAEADAAWRRIASAAMAAPVGNALPSDAQVIGAVARQAPADAIVVAAAGGLPGELHKLWPTGSSGGYHVEYGFSCMGYEIAGGLGAKMAAPDREVLVMVGDGSYLMMNSELATAVSLGMKIIVVLLDNGGFGCINRLQQATGSAPFNNLLADSRHEQLVPIDFAVHAASLGAFSERVDSIAALEAALERARADDRTCVIVIDTDATVTTEGGAWWDVAVPAVSDRPAVGAAREAYEQRLRQIAEDQ
jgi:3D-(3,5/4)-trihydroxycyclohexane-1,2-dione acylhydrolase (decyclizing)